MMELFKDQVEFTEKYQIIKIIHDYDNDTEKRKVYLVLNKLENKYYVCKDVEYIDEVSSNSPSPYNLKNKENRNLEYSCLKKYSNKEVYPHLNIVKYIEHFETKDKDGYILRILIITEYYKDGDLSMAKDIRFSNVIYLFLRMIIILNEFKNDIIHRDIKPQNIFIIKNDEGFEFYLGDMGSASVLKTESNSTLIGTNQYIAPEILKNSGYTNMVDIYGLGRTMLSLTKNSIGVINRVYIKLFERMCDEDIKKRPDINQIVELMCRQYDNQCIDLEIFKLIKSEFHFVHTKSCIDYLKTILNKKCVPIHFKILIQETLNDGIGTGEFFKVLELLSNIRSEFNEFIFSQIGNTSDGKEIELLDTHFNFMEENQLMKSLSYQDIKIIKNSTPITDFLDDNIQIHTNIAKSVLIFIPIKYRFHKVINERPDDYTVDIQLKAMFHLILVTSEILENGPDFMFIRLITQGGSNHLYLVPPLNSVQQQLKPLSNYEFKFVFPFCETFSNNQSRSLPFFNSFPKSSIHQDPLITELASLDYLLDTSLPSICVIQKLILSILNEEKRLLDNYSNLGFEHYMKEFKIIKDKFTKESLKFIRYMEPSKTIETITRFSKNSTSEDDETLYLISYNGGVDNYAIMPLNVYATSYGYKDIHPALCRTVLREDIKILKYLDYKKYKRRYLYLLYKLPQSLSGNCYNAMKSFKQNGNHNIDKKDILNKLIIQHLNNYQTDICWFIENDISNFSFSLIISNDQNNNQELFYSYSSSLTVHNSFFGSFNDICKWVYGEDFNKEIQTISSIFRSMQTLIWYHDLIITSDYFRITFRFTNFHYYLERFGLVFKGVYLKKEKYSIYKIGEDQYYIIDIKESNHIIDSFPYDPLYLMELENVKTEKKFICFRKQINNTEKEGYVLLQNSLSFSEDDNLLPPKYIVQDNRLTFQFFPLCSITLSIEDFNLKEKDYNHIVIIRSLLFYLQYLIKNIGDSKFILFILLDLQTVNYEKDNQEKTYLYFDIIYFIKCVYGIDIYYHWDDFVSSLSTPGCLLLNYIQSNYDKIINDIICMDILENDKSMNHFKPLNISLISKINENVDLVLFNQKKYIRKTIGSISHKINNYKDQGLDSDDPLSKTIKLYKLVPQLKGSMEILSNLFENINKKSKKEKTNEFHINNFLKTNELKILQKLKGTDGVVQLHDYYFENDSIYLLIDYFDGCNLNQIENLNQVEVIKILIQMCEILKKLEDLDIYHRDIKPDNVLIKRDGHEIKVCLADFGISQFGEYIKNNESLYYSRDGTFGFQSPEIYRSALRCVGDIKTNPYKMDIFSFGCTIKFLIHKFNLVLPPVISNALTETIHINYNKRICLADLIKIIK